MEAPARPGAAGLQGPAADTQDSGVQKWEGVAGSGVAAGKSDPDPAPRMQAAVRLRSLLSPRAVSGLRQWMPDSEHTGQEGDRC